MVSSQAPVTKRLGPILAALQRAYPMATCALRCTNPLELMVATILSAQCTDALVNKVTVDLFKKYRSAKEYAAADVSTLEQDIAHKIPRPDGRGILLFVFDDPPGPSHGLTPAASPCWNMR